jgi:predicted DNA-binding transcriptional regulator AlpA
MVEADVMAKSPTNNQTELAFPDSLAEPNDILARPSGTAVRADVPSSAGETGKPGASGTDKNKNRARETGVPPKEPVSDPHHVGVTPKPRNDWHPGVTEAHLTVWQVARYLGVSRATIWRWSKDANGFPAPIKLGKGSSRWRLTDLDAFVEARARG